MCTQGPKAVLGPGTGLGQALLFWDTDQDDYKVFPSEGAHAAFAPRGWKQRALQAWVENKLGYCEVEHVGSRFGPMDIHPLSHGSRCKLFLTILLFVCRMK
jgi:glucokinase